MAPTGETELDIGALTRALWRRAWLPVLLAILAAIATYMLLSRVQPLYTADTSILIEERESPLTRPREGAEPRVNFDEPAIQSQVEVIRSREIADTVVDKLNLTQREDFDPARHPSLITSLMVMLGLEDHPADDTVRQRVMESYFERLSVYPVGRSRVIGVSFEAPDPDLAADVANEVARTFVELQQQAQRESALAATAWLEQEIDRLRGRVAEAEQAISDFRTSNDLFTTGTSGNLSEQQLNDINAELARARAARAEAEARAALIQSLLSDGGSLEASEEVLNSQLIQRLRERQVALQSQIAELSTTLLPGHPRIRALEGQLGNLDAQIVQEAERVLASLQTAARVAAAREDSLQESLNSAMADASRSNEDEIQLRALEREATAQRDLLESFLGRYREAAARTDADYLPADARIISLAVPPRNPSYPKKAMMSAIAAIAVFLIVIALLLLREFTSGRAFRIISYGAPAAPVDRFGSDESGDVSPAVTIRAVPAGELRPSLADRAPLRRFAPPAAAVPDAAKDDGDGSVASPEARPSTAARFERDGRARLQAMADRDAWHEPRSTYQAAERETGDDVGAAAVEGNADSRRDEARSVTMPSASERPAEDWRQTEIGTEDEAGADMRPAADPALSHERGREDPGAISPAAEIVEEVAGEAEDIDAAEPAAADADEAEREPGPVVLAEAVDDAAPAADIDEDVAAEPPAMAASPIEAPQAEMAQASPHARPEGDPPGTAELATIVSGGAVRVALFAGAEGGEGAGDIAYATAREVARGKQRCVVLDIGARRSPALAGPNEPGLTELLAGEFSFGEVIRRDEDSHVHVIPMGRAEKIPALQRLQLVVGALTHTYDKVLVVADSLADWPDQHMRPDLAAIVCGPETTEDLRTELYDAALARGARSAIIVRYSGDGNGIEASEAA